jgi:MFS family permease
VQERQASPPLGGRVAVTVWSAAVIAYGVALFHRFSLGVAGIGAAERFGASAAVLATFSVVQLVVYAALQIPVGAVLDRLGSRRLLVTGASLMALGQLLFAVADDVGTALLARVLLGCGDAMTFISVLRLIAVWFPPRLNPVMVQVTGLLGQLGAVASAVPLVAALDTFGWTPTFLAAAAIGLAAAALVLVVVRDAPYAAPTTATTDSRGPAGVGVAAEPTGTLRALGQTLRLTWAHPGTRLGLWSHWATQFSGVTFAVLWGYPFLVTGQGLSPRTAGVLLTVLTVAGMACSPLMGLLVGRHPYHRSWLVLAVVGITATGWALVLLWPGRAPLPMLVLLVLAMATNVPGSMIAFDYARTFNPAARLGSATGIVNVGGFSAAILTVLLVGVVLDVLTPGDSQRHTLETWRWAMAVQYPLWALGAVQVVRYRRIARRRLASEDPEAFAALRRGEVLPPER